MEKILNYNESLFKSETYFDNKYKQQYIYIIL